MSWLNLNESLNNIKGQISNFANNVLADESEGGSVATVEVEELQKLCAQQEIEIRKLKAANDELRTLQFQNGQHSGDDAWHSENGQNKISDLKKLIRDLENEKFDLVAQLEQLDNDNQQNLNEMVAVREKIKEENMELKEKFGKLKQQNIAIASREEKLKKELEELKKCLHENNNDAGSSQQFKPELEEARKELSVLKSTHATLQKVLEDTKASNDIEMIETIDKLKRVEAENKIIYAELQKSKEEIKKHEAKTIEDEENFQKLVCILDTYEEKVRLLKEELGKVSEDASRKDEVASKLEIELGKSTKALRDANAEKDQLWRQLEEIANKKQPSEENDEAMRKLKHENEGLKEEIRKLTEECSTANTHSESLKLELESVLSEKSNINNDLQTIKELLENSNLEVKSLKIQLAEVSNIKRELREELDNIKQQYEESTANSEIIDKLKLELESFKFQRSSFEEQLEKNRKEEEILKAELETASKNNKNLLEELEKAAKNHDDYVRNIEQNQKNEELEELRQKNKELLLERDNIHKTYINIITENVRRYYAETEECSKEEIQISGNAEYEEFNKHVENILKILLDFRNKCDLLEKEVCELRDEKNRILNEKNNEIEKLLQNSEVLSQEVISKTETLKEYEKECSELMKSNEILIAELEGYKNNSGLQTISESNEDNMILLESQLETAIRRIKELERVANSNVQTKISDSSPTYKRDEEYKILLNNFDKLQIDYEMTKRDLDQANYELKNLRKENHELKASLEKCKCDFENTEYQLEEVNVSIDSLKEEIDDYKEQIGKLLEENKQLQICNKNGEDIRTELNGYKERLLLEEDERKKLEVLVRNLQDQLTESEKVVNNFKSQCESLSKETIILRDLKMEVDAKLILERDASSGLRQKVALQEAEENKLKGIIKDLEEKLISLHSVDINDCSTNFESEKMRLQFEITNLQADLDESHGKIKTLENQLKELTNSRNELIQMVTTKHQESLAYHSEIQRLTQILQTEVAKHSTLEDKIKSASHISEDLAKKNEEIDRLADQNAFLKEKCEVLAKNLLEEQSKVERLVTEKSEPSEKEVTLSKNLDRLQSHLIELEEHYTEELLQAEQKNAELQAKVNEIQQREKNSSTMYTSVSIRANQQVEGLQNQLQIAVTERDELRKKISDAEDYAKKQAAALANLQFVLEQFQKDKEKDVAKETERIRRQITSEKRIQDELKTEISSLKAQLEESKQGLQAAARLSDQLENSKKLCATLKEEVQQLQSKVTKSEENIRQLTSQTDGKVDKTLVKNLIIGYVSSHAADKDKQQILKIIATVLDFNQQDHEKVKLNETQQSSWLGSVLSPLAGPQSMSQESLSQAFVRFLENESKPRIVPSLLNAEQPQAGSSERATPRQSPIVLSEIVLPTFADFAQNRNSSSILKDVLKDNS